MSIAKEYKGEAVIGKLKARLVPPNDQYPDCMCEIVMTEHYLYVLEDNFNGTYETHFTFPLTHIEDMETQEIEFDDSQKGEKDFASMNNLMTALCGFLGGKKAVPEQLKSQENRIFFAIIYNNGMGSHSKLYFKDLQMSSRDFKKAYQSARKSIY